VPALKKNLFFFLAAISIVAAAAQTKKPKTRFDTAYDFYYKGELGKSLSVYKDVTDEDSQDFADALVLRGLVFTDSISFEEGKKYLDQAEKFSGKIKDAKVVSLLYFGLGSGYYTEGDFQRSVKYFLKCEFLAATNKLTANQKSASFYLAENYRRLFKIPLANQYIKKAIELAKIMKDSSAIIRYYSVLASNYLYYANEDTATYVYCDTILKYLKDADLYTNKNNPRQTSFLYSSYAKAYYAENDFTGVTFYTKKAYDANCLAKDTPNIIVSLSNIAQNYIEMKKLDSALLYQQKMAELKKNDRSLMSKDQRNFFYNYYQI
jgi:tetratricopeptide (TPR) repeat protein